MREAKIIQIAPGEVGVRKDRVTPLNPKAVEVIRQSVEETGEIRDPVHLRRTKTGYELIDGRHRLEVARQMDLPSIPARVWDCTLDEARLMEADANVTFTHMSPIDLAVSLAQRKRAYEQLHPETKRGVAGAAARHGMQTTKLSFAEFIADLVGVTPRNIQRVIAAGAALRDDELVALRKATKRLGMSDIQALSKIEDEVERSTVVDQLASGVAKNVSAARRKLLPADPGQAPSKNPADEAFRKLKDAWDRAPLAVKKRFCLEQAHELWEVQNKGASLANSQEASEE